MVSSTVRFIDHDRLETTLQRGVLFDVLAVLVQRGRADAVQLAAGQHGLEQVARIHRAVGLARADDGVQLIDEEDDLALGLFDLVQDGSSGVPQTRRGILHLRPAHPCPDENTV